MKKVILVALSILTLATVYGQAPKKFNYQAVARNSAGSIIANQQVALKVSIRDGGPNGTIVYQEQHDTITTNAFGIITVVIGGGTILQGDMNTVNWITGTKFMQVEFDAANNGNYVNMGTTQLLSVPFAMYAETSGSQLPGPAGATGPQGPIGPVGATGPQGPQGVQGPQGPGTAAIPGSQIGSTIRWNGTEWVEDTTSIFNGTSAGIGTSTPVADLQVNSTSTTSNIIVTSTVSGTTAADGLNIGLNATGEAFVMNNEPADLILGANAVEKVRITDSGRMGILETNPGANLDVNGNFILGASGTVINNVIKTIVTATVPSTNSFDGQTFTINVPGVTSTSATVHVSPITAISTGNIIAWARVSAPGTIEVRVQNATNGYINTQNNVQLAVTVIE